MLIEFFQSFFKNDVTAAIGILLASILLANITYILLKKYITKLTKKTETEIDDIIVKGSAKPLYMAIVSIGVYSAIKTLESLEKHALFFDRVFFTLFVIIASYYVSKMAGIFISRWLKDHGKRTPQLLSRVVTIVAYAVGFMMILGYFNIEITPLIATLGIGGIAVGFALQDTLKNFFAGLHIISDKPITIGDYIELDMGVEGYVEDIGWRSVRVKTIGNNIIVIPNSKLAESIITNDSMPENNLSLVVSCGVSYGSDLDKVEEVSLDTARKIQETVKGAVKDWEPLFRFKEFGDSNINFYVVLRIDEYTSKYSVRHEFIKALKKRFDEEGIEISWPIRKVYYGNKQ